MGRGKKKIKVIESKQGNANFFAGRPFLMKMDNNEKPKKLQFFLDEDENPSIEIKAPIINTDEIYGDSISVSQIFDIKTHY